MALPSSSPAKQLVSVVPLSEREGEEFLAGFDMGQYWHSHTDLELVKCFRGLSGQSQRLLVRGFDCGRLNHDFVIQVLDIFGFVLFGEWDDTGDYESFSEATTIADSRIFSSLLVLEHLGSTLDSLGHQDKAHYMWAEMVLNEFVDVSETKYPESEDFRLSTMEDVAEVAAITTYVAVDGFLHNQELADHNRDYRDSLVVMVPDIFPRSSEDEGNHCDYIVVQHPELEHKLRGRSLEDYKAALAFVRERGWAGFTVEDEGFSLEHLAGTHAALSDGCL
jgi:hypothetical protein